MSTIVKHYDKKTGKTRVYESTPHYDPVTKQSRPKRKYLGTIDDKTGELIPSSGRRGRTPSGKYDAAINTNEVSEKTAYLDSIIADKDAEIESLKAEINCLKIALKSYSKICDTISNALNEVPDNI
jgi:hypothetical protein